MNTIKSKIKALRRGNFLKLNNKLIVLIDGKIQDVGIKLRKKYKTSYFERTPMSRKKIKSILEGSTIINAKKHK